MNLATFNACVAEIQRVHDNGGGFDIQVMLEGGHCLRGPFSYMETKPPCIKIEQGTGIGAETFALPVSSILAVGGCC